nr:serine hydrolase domain-containing protein [uncultured Undibacterium sp.]
MTVDISMPSKKNFTWCAAFFCLLSVNIAALAQESDRTIARSEAQSIDRFERILDRQLIERFSPGMAIAVVANGEIVFAKGYGVTDLQRPQTITGDTPFYIASTTKSLTAHIAIELEQQGRFSLKTPVKQLMPQLRFHPDINVDLITLESLLNHTHGIDGDGPITFRTAFSAQYRDIDDLLSLLIYHRPAKNGNQFRYSNIGPILAAYIIERKTNKSWQDLIDEYIFKRLDMRHSANRTSQLSAVALAQPYEFKGDVFQSVAIKKEDANMHAAGGTFSSANDMAAWLGVHLEQSKWNGKTVYDAKLIAQAFKQTATQQRNVAGFNRKGWSLGWDIAEYKGQLSYARPGGFAGFSSHISMMPERGFGVVVLANGGQLASVVSQYIVDVLYAELLQEPDRIAQRIQSAAKLEKQYSQIVDREKASMAQRAQRQTTMPLPLSTYSGQFKSPVASLIFTELEGRLQIKIGKLSETLEVFDATQHAFRTEITGSGQIIKFLLEDGKVTGIDFGGDVYRKLSL